MDLPDLMFDLRICKMDLPDLMFDLRICKNEVR
jgi:hypothetical protein